MGPSSLQEPPTTRTSLTLPEAPNASTTSMSPYQSSVSDISGETRAAKIGPDATLGTPLPMLPDLGIRFGVGGRRLGRSRRRSLLLRATSGVARMRQQGRAGNGWEETPIR